MWIDTKNCNGTSIPFSSLPIHQTEFLSRADELGAKSYYLMYFSKYDNLICLDIKDFNTLKSDCIDNGRKSIPYKDIERCGNVILEWEELIDILNDYNDYNRIRLFNGIDIK